MVDPDSDGVFRQDALMFRLRDARLARVAIPSHLPGRFGGAAGCGNGVGVLFRRLGKFSHVIPFHLLLAAVSGGSRESSATESILKRWLSSRRRSAGSGRSTTTCARMRRCG
jgi:hypothetical protein